MLYAIVIMAMARDEFVGDEGRYAQYATNLTQGFYTDAEQVDLWSGPGYPIVLVPFVALDAPWLAAKLFNAVLLVGALFYFCGTLRLYMPERTALRFTYLFGLYPPLLKESFVLLTEPLMVLVVCGFAYHYCRSRYTDRRAWLQLGLAGAYAGGLALTKIFFGYVLVTALLAGAGLYLWKRRAAFRDAAIVYAVALGICVPYLAHTYSLTGKLFYWGTSGGLSLYWMTTPHEGEYGDWHGRALDRHPQLRANHGAFFESIDQLPSVEWDAALRRQALHNLRAHPGSYLRNWVANVSRLFFAFPHSYRDRYSPLIVLIVVPNLVLLGLAGLCAGPTWRHRRRVPDELWMILLFAAVTLAGSSLLSAYERQLRPVVPLAAVWIAYALVHLRGAGAGPEPPTGRAAPSPASGT